MRLRGYRRHGGECCFRDLFKAGIGYERGYELENGGEEDGSMRRACHDRVVVMLLAETEVSVDLDGFPTFCGSAGRLVNAGRCRRDFHEDVGCHCQI